jgi:hypothetical protein
VLLLSPTAVQCVAPSGFGENVTVQVARASAPRIRPPDARAAAQLVVDGLASANFTSALSYDPPSVGAVTKCVFLAVPCARW